MANPLYLFEEALVERATDLLELCRRNKLKIATAESCTGGLIAGLLTEISGSSDVVDRGFVTYSNGAKSDMVGVAPDLIDTHGAVSAEVARAMAEGALKASKADIAVAVTGVAGPNGGTDDKPVGLVHFACARKDGETIAREERYGDLGRNGIRAATIGTALRMIGEQASA